MIEYIYQNIIGFIALIISIAIFISTQRRLSSRARADALGKVEKKITELNIRLEAEVAKLEDGLDRCIKERITFKQEITTLKKQLKEINDR